MAGHDADEHEAAERAARLEERLEGAQRAVDRWRDAARIEHGRVLALEAERAVLAACRDRVDAASVAYHTELRAPLLNAATLRSLERAIRLALKAAQDGLDALRGDAGDGGH